MEYELSLKDALTRVKTGKVLAQGDRFLSGVFIGLYQNDVCCGDVESINTYLTRCGDIDLFEVDDGHRRQMYKVFKHPYDSVKPRRLV